MDRNVCGGGKRELASVGRVREGEAREGKAKGKERWGWACIRKGIS